MSLPTTTTTPIALPELAELIDREHHDFEAATAKAVAHAFEAGRYLLEAKAQVQHGGWQLWVRKNTSVSLRMARAYCQLAGLTEGKRQRVAGLSLREALKAIAAPRKKPAEEAPPLKISGRGFETVERGEVSVESREVPMEPRMVRSKALLQPPAAIDLHEAHAAKSLAEHIGCALEYLRDVEPERAAEALMANRVTGADLEELSAWAADMAARLSD